jgi:ABC-type multidrug transport system fused ATPase/permease subunit
MTNIRNWYIFITSAISLNGTAWALIAMLRNLVRPADIRLDREFLALQIAVIIIGIPIYYIHWRWAQRLAAGDQEERRSPLRFLYLYAILAATLAPMLASTFSLFAYDLNDLFDGALLHFLVTVIPLGVLFYYHQTLIDQENKTAPLSGENAGIRRLYHFGFSAAGLWMMVQGAVNLIHWLFDPPVSVFTAVSSSRGLITPEIVRLLIGLAVWFYFWRWLQAAFNGPRPEEKQSVLRKAYLYLVVLVSSLSAVSAASMILAGYFRQLLDVSSGRPGEGPEMGYAVIIAMAVVWAYHARVLKDDAAAAPDTQRAAAVRGIYLYLVAAVGLGAFLTGLLGDVMVLIDMLTTRAIFGMGAKEQVAWATSTLLAGLPVWLLPWRAAQLEAAAEDDPIAAQQRRSTARRVFLYLYLFAAVMAALGSLIYIVYQLLLLLLGERTSANLLNDMAQALSFALIGGALLGYHGQVLRADGRLDLAQHADKMKEFKVALLDGGEGAFGAALKRALAEQLPHLSLTPIGLSEPAAAAMGTDIDAKDAAKAIAAADLVVAPWDVALGGASSAITKAVHASPAAKLLAPLPAPGWHLAGVESAEADAIVDQTVQSVKQILAGEQVRLARRMGLGTIIFIVFGVLCLLTFLLSVVGEFIF